MVPLLVRLGLLTLGLGILEIGLTNMLGQGLEPVSALELLIGSLLVVAGTAAMIGPLLSAQHSPTDAPITDAPIGGPDHD